MLRNARIWEVLSITDECADKKMYGKSAGAIYPFIMCITSTSFAVGPSIRSPEACLVVLSARISLECQDDPAAAAVFPVLTQVNALPGSHIQFALGDWDRQAAADGGGLDMRRHVVGAFVDMPVEWGVFRHGVIKMGLHVDAHCRIGVLVDCQAGAAVLDEQVAQADGKLRQLRQLRQDFIGDEVKSAAL